MKPPAVQSLFCMSLVFVAALSAPSTCAAETQTSPTRVVPGGISKSYEYREPHEDWDFPFILSGIYKSQALKLEMIGKGSKPKGKVKGKLKSLLNFMIDSRGTDWSKEGADLAVDDPLVVASSQTHFYQVQNQTNDLHWRAISLIAMLSGSLGDHFNSSPKKTEALTAKLRAVIGQRRTNIVKQWMSDDDFADTRLAIAKTVKLGLSERIDEHKTMLKAALERDAVVASIRQDLAPYARGGKKKRVASKLAYSTLGVAAFVPNLIAPIAETAFLATMMANGGPEQDKLLKELYYAKLYDKRVHMLEQEVNLALDTRALSLASGNPLLYRFSRAFTEYLCGTTVKRDLFPASTVTANGRIISVR